METGTKQGVNWRALFARRGFRYFFSGMLVSLFGSGMNFAGVCWYVLNQTGSTVAVSVLLILLTAPGLLVPIVGGVLIDRVDRRYLAMAIDLTRGAIIGSTGALIFLGHGGLGAIYGMALFNGVGYSMYWAAINSLIQEVIPMEELVGANSAVMIAVQGGLVLSGALVEFFYDRVGISGILAIDAATYAVSAFCLYQLRRGYFPPHALAHSRPAPDVEASLTEAEETLVPPLAERMPETNFFSELKEGIAYLRRQPAVLAIGLTYAVMIASVVSGNVLLVAVAKDLLHAGAKGYGALEAGWAIGAVTGGLAAGELARRFPAATVLLVALLTLVLGHIIFPYIFLLILAAVVQGIFGSCRAIGGILTQSSLMSTVPQHLMGRTQSAFTLLSTLLQMLMSFVLGWLAELVGLHLAFLVLAMIYSVAALAAWRARSLTLHAVAASA